MGPLDQKIQILEKINNSEINGETIRFFLKILSDIPFGKNQQYLIEVYKKETRNEFQKLLILEIIFLKDKRKELEGDIQTYSKYLKLIDLVEEIMIKTYRYQLEN